MSAHPDCDWCTETDAVVRREVAALTAERDAATTTEWTAMTDYRHPGDWRPCGVSGEREHAESELDDWVKDVGAEHMRLGCRIVTEWRPVSPETTP